MRSMMLVAPVLAGLALAATTATGQPAMSPQVAEGQRLYAENCAACHGEDGRRGAGFQTPIWGGGRRSASSRPRWACLNTTR